MTLARKIGRRPEPTAPPDEPAALELAGDLAERIEATAAAIEQWALAENIPILGFDRRLIEQHAARALGCSTGTLRNWKSEGRLPSYSVPRSSYRIVDIARYIEENRD